MNLAQQTNTDFKMNFCAAELSVTYRNTQHPELRDYIKNSMQAYNYALPLFTSCLELRECFYAIYLNHAHAVIGVFKVSEGGIAATLVDARLILSVALSVLATSIIICHNHPSGQTKPSKEDIKVTKDLKDACKLHDISLLDHIIVTSENYTSLSDEGLI